MVGQVCPTGCLLLSPVLEEWEMDRSVYVLLFYYLSCCSLHGPRLICMLPEGPNILVTLMVNLTVSLILDCPKFRESVRVFHQQPWITEYMVQTGISVTILDPF